MMARFQPLQFAVCCVAMGLLMLLVKYADSSQTTLGSFDAHQVRGSSTPKQEDFRLEILPNQLLLSGADANQRLLVHLLQAGERGAQITDQCKFEVENPTICEVRGNHLVALADGQTRLIVTFGELKKSVEVQVNGANQERALSFEHDVLPVFAKLGCNSGACHGALAGKGGFRLSLRGYDPESDFFTITQQAQGRRVEPRDPGRSLLLAKPSGAIPHKGGVRYDVDSLDYRIVADWISAGTAPPSAAEPNLESIEIYPDQATLPIGSHADLIVLAKYSDGRISDVTRWVKWSSANQAVANVDQRGQIKVIGPGEGAITAWFSSRIAIARLTSPFPSEVEPAVFERAHRRNFIDKISLNQLKKLNLPPSPRCSDEEFIRRTYLDAIGTLPTSEEVREFLSDPSNKKRDALIDHLLSRPEFVDYWTYHWSDLLLINGTRLRPNAVKSYYEWIREHVAHDTAWDDFVRELLIAQGSTFENGATNFYSLHQDPESMSENASQAFLGLSISCAKCHNHPLEKWTNDQYYGMASLFARVRAKGWGGDARNGDGKRTVYVVSKGELIQPRTGIPQPPTPLDGDPLEFDDPRDRRVHLASWMTSPENPYFARAITNRVWAKFFGIGLVEPVDDLRVSNPASNEELLTVASQYLIDQDFNLKSLMRQIMRSETYQRTSQVLPENETDHRYFSHYYPRRLMAEVLLDGISKVTDAPSRFTKVVFQGADTQNTDFYPEGTKAIQLYDSAVQSYFLKTFGRNQREITCECERSNEPSLIQVLHMANGTTLNEKLRHADNRIARNLKNQKSSESIIEELYLSALARFPTDSERQRLLAVLEEDDDQGSRILLEDLYWSVLSSREFLFNH